MAFRVCWSRPKKKRENNDDYDNENIDDWKQWPLLTAFSCGRFFFILQIISLMTGKKDGSLYVQRHAIHLFTMTMHLSCANMLDDSFDLVNISAHIILYMKCWWWRFGIDIVFSQKKCRTHIVYLQCRKQYFSFGIFYGLGNALSTE